MLTIVYLVLLAGTLSFIALVWSYNRGYQRAQRDSRRAARSRAQTEEAVGSIPAPKPLPRSCRDHGEPVILYLKPIGKKTRHGRN